MLMEKYIKKYSTYEPAKFECLEDLSPTYRNARALISFIFVVLHVDKDKIVIPDSFEASDTPVYTKPHKYQEVEYREQPSELHMEFYLQIFDMFCLLGDTIYSVFSGSKILCAGLVSHSL